MNVCISCKGATSDSVTKHHVDLGVCDVIIKNVPCRKCTQCGEIIYNIRTGNRLEQIIDSLKDSLMEIAVVQYSETAAA